VSLAPILTLPALTLSFPLPHTADDQDILDSVTYFRGGPDSQAVVGDKYVYKHDLDATKEGQKKAPPPGASKSVVILGPTSHSTEHKQYVLRCAALYHTALLPASTALL
jgi:hypothetical protein